MSSNQTGEKASGGVEARAAPSNAGPSGSSSDYYPPPVYEPTPGASNYQYAAPQSSSYVDSGYPAGANYTAPQAYSAPTNYSTYPQSFNPAYAASQPGYYQNAQTTVVVPPTTDYSYAPMRANNQPTKRKAWTYLILGLVFCACGGGLLALYNSRRCVTGSVTYCYVGLSGVRGLLLIVLD